MKTIIIALLLITYNLLGDSCELLNIPYIGTWSVAQYVLKHEIVNTKTNYSWQLRSQIWSVQTELSTIEYFSWYYGENYINHTYRLYTLDTLGESYQSDIQISSYTDVIKGTTVETSTHDTSIIPGLGGTGYGGKANTFKNGAGEIVRNTETRIWSRYLQNISTNTNIVGVLKTYSFNGVVRNPNKYDTLYVPQRQSFIVTKDPTVWSPSICSFNKIRVNWLENVGSYCSRIYHGDPMPEVGCKEGW